ncbi:MAG: hypothetical protein ACYCU0_04475 [Solirubrobacteraceae bacterium]
MERQRPQTWIVGVGEARSAPARDDLALNELAWEAVSPALQDAGVKLPQITGAVTASQDFWDGRTISSMNVNELVGGAVGSEAKVAADGAQALSYAAARIEDGDQRLNLVVAHAKESGGDRHSIELAACDPFFERQLDPDETVLAAFQAQLLYAQGRYCAEHAARVVCGCRSRSQTLEPVEVAEVLSSVQTATPLRELDRAPSMDAATALVVCDDIVAGDLGGAHVRVVASASRTGAYWSQRSALHEAPEALAAATDALELAQWDLADVETIEINAPFAFQQLIVADALGLGEGERLVQRFERGEINPSGAWLAGCAGTVAGLHSVADAARRLRESGGRALVHATTGLCLQSHHVILLESVSGGSR